MCRSAGGRGRLCPRGPSLARPRRESRTRSNPQTPGGVRATLLAVRTGWSADDRARVVRAHSPRVEQRVRRSRPCREPARQGSGRQGGDEPRKAGGAAHGRDAGDADHGNRAPARAGRPRPARRGRALATALCRRLRRSVAARRLSGTRQRLRPALLQRCLSRSADHLRDTGRRTLSNHVDAPRPHGSARPSAGIQSADLRPPGRRRSRAAGSLRHGMAVPQLADGNRPVPRWTCGGGQGGERRAPRDARLRASGRSAAIARSLPHGVRRTDRSGTGGSQVFRRTPAQARTTARADRSRRRGTASAGRGHGPAPGAGARACRGQCARHGGPTGAAGRPVQRRFAGDGGDPGGDARRNRAAGGRPRGHEGKGRCACGSGGEGEREPAREGGSRTRSGVSEDNAGERPATALDD